MWPVAVVVGCSYLTDGVLTVTSGHVVELNSLDANQPRRIKYTAEVLESSFLMSDQ